MVYKSIREMIDILTDDMTDGEYVVWLRETRKEIEERLSTFREE